MTPEPAENPLDPGRFYDELGEGEWERLERDPVSRLEFERTLDYLRESLPESGRVLDVGGGAGRYGVWLAERGYDVTLVDVSGVQCRVARDKAREHGVADSVHVWTGDIRALPVDDTFDAVLALGGPLSHVVDGTEREAALAELRRAAADRAPVLVSVMGRLAALQAVVARSPDEYPLLESLAESGDYTADIARDHGVDPANAPFECHYYRADELAAELADAGFDVETVAGLEGVAANTNALAREAVGGDSDRESTLYALSAQLGEDRSVADLSNHILAVARA